MRTFAVGISVAVLLTCHAAWAQTSTTTGSVSVVDNAYDGYYWRPHSSTYAEGLGHGLGDVLRSAGQLAYLTSQAAINFNHARSLALDNAAKSVHTYFDLRRVNDQARAEMRGQRMSREELVRAAQAAVPRRLSPGELDPVTGRVAWPIMLRANQYADYRDSLDKLFADRITDGLSTDSYLTMLRLIGELADELKGNIAVTPPMDYVAAKRFLGSLAQEARAPIVPAARLGMTR